MKLTLLAAITVLFLSCSNDRKVTEIPQQASKLKSDILIASSADKSFSEPNTKDKMHLMIVGESLLEGTAVIKVTNTKGIEVYCETFPANKLIQEEYKTANSALKAQHLREVVEGFFVDELFPNIKKDGYVGI